MNVKDSTAAALSSSQRLGPGFLGSRGKLRAIWLAVLVAGLLGLSSCAALTKQISYGGRGKLNLNESGDMSGQFSLEIDLDSRR